MPKDTIENRAIKRVKFLSIVAADLIDSGVIPNDRVYLREKRLYIVAICYFILNDTYKKWRIKNGHFTEEPKIAALMAIAILKIRPFKCMFPTDTRSVQEARCNEIFAITAALSIIDKKLNVSSLEEKDFWYRIIDIMSEINSQTLEPFVTDINMSVKNSFEGYIQEIHKNDRLSINTLISIFELVSGKISV